MNVIGVILLVLALVAFVVAAVLGRRPDRGFAVAAIGTGLALWVLVQLLAALGVGA